MYFYSFDQPEAQVTALGQSIAQNLFQAVQQCGQAKMAVSGGRSPEKLFSYLSHLDLPWNKIHITLVDDRLVPEDHLQSNILLVRRFLLQDKAVTAQFYPLHDDQGKFLSSHLPLPYDVVVLGMGLDGHTASLFPDMPGIAQALSLDCSDVLLHGLSPVEPRNRVTHSLAALFSAGHIYLLIEGEEKLKLWREVQFVADPMVHPIYAFTSHPNFDIFYAG